MLPAPQLPALLPTTQTVRLYHGAVLFAGEHAYCKSPFCLRTAFALPGGGAAVLPSKTLLCVAGLLRAHTASAHHLLWFLSPLA
jgi:hypothetical protein